MRRIKNIPKLEVLRNLPKVELHAHLTASFTVESFQKLLDRKGIKEDVSILEFSNIDDIFNKVFPLLKLCTDEKADLEFINQECFETFIEDNVRYLEVRTTPKQLKDIDSIEYVNTVIDSMEEYQDRIETRLLLSVNRVFPPEYHDEVFEELKTNSRWHKWVVGVDFCGDPWLRKISDYDRFFQIGRDLGMKLTIHTAESPEQVHETSQILDYEPERLGHYIHATDEELIRAREMGSVIEICPSSNMACEGYDDISNHGVARMRDFGLKTVICTDDILLFNNNLSEEIELICSGFGYDYEFCKQMTLDAIDASFIREETVKDQIRKEVEEAYSGIL